MANVPPDKNTVPDAPARDAVREESLDAALTAALAEVDTGGAAHTALSVDEPIPLTPRPAPSPPTVSAGGLPPSQEQPDDALSTPFDGRDESRNAWVASEEGFFSTGIGDAHKKFRRRRRNGVVAIVLLFVISITLGALLGTASSG